MKSINIALLSIGRDTSIIFGFKKVFKNLKINGKIIGLDADSNAVGLHFSDIGLKVPLYTDKGYNKKLSSIIDDYNIDLIIPTADHDLIWWEKNRNYFKKQHNKFLFSDVDTINNTLFKKNFLNILIKENIPCPMIIHRGRIRLHS